MLVLSRQRDQSILIDLSHCTIAELATIAAGPPIRVTVVDIRGDKVRIGTEAPPEVDVHRQEVWEAIRREERAAAIDV